jgi:hypothetical protein
MGRLTRVLLGTTLSMLLIVCGSVAAADFSADLVISGGTMNGQGKIHVKGYKMRQDVTISGMGETVQITDLDNGYTYVLTPETKTYIKMKVETDGKGFRPENFTSMHSGDLKADVKKEGREEVNGYGCDKYVITYENVQMGSMTQWFADDLNYPVRIVFKSDMMGEVVQELQNIRPGNVDASLFDLPAGYTEMKMPEN